MRWRVTLMSALVWGSGQVANKQKIKGLIFFLAQVALVCIELFSGTLAVLTGAADRHFRNCGLFIKGVWGLATLGEIPRTSSRVPVYDHSLMLMINGLIALAVLLLFAIIWVINMRDAYGTRKRMEKGESLSSVASLRSGMDRFFEYIAITPGLLLMLFVSVLPILFTMLVSLTNYNTNTIPPRSLVEWVGFQNFVDIVRLPVWGRTFVGVFAWTVVWALLAAFTSYLGGMLQAVLISSKHVRAKKFWRGIFMLPWAIPAFVSVLVFSNVFHKFGPINQMLTSVGLIANPIPFLSSAAWARTTLVLVNLWLGFPYFMALMSGVMSTINTEMYEAAEIDGANAAQIFRRITFPFIISATAPQLIFSITYNFNNFGTVFFLTKGGPLDPNYILAGSTDLLITWIYKLTWDQRMYNFASVMSILIFVLLATVAGWNLLRTRVFKED